MIRKGRVLGTTRQNPQGQAWQATLDVTVVRFNPVITVSSSPLPATVVQVTFRLHVSDDREVAAVDMRPDPDGSVIHDRPGFAISSFTSFRQPGRLLSGMRRV